MLNCYEQHYQNYLMHHGVKGMKWGVRNEKKTAGTGRLNRLNKSIAKNESRIAKINGKKRVSDRNYYKREYYKTSNQIKKNNVKTQEKKVARNEAKNKYGKDSKEYAKANKAYKDAKLNNTAKNNVIAGKWNNRQLLQNTLGMNAADQGYYMRKKDQGDSTFKAGAKTAGKMVAKAAIAGAAVSAINKGTAYAIGRKYANR